MERQFLKKITSSCLSAPDGVRCGEDEKQQDPSLDPPPFACFAASSWQSKIKVFGACQQAAGSYKGWLTDRLAQWVVSELADSCCCLITLPRCCWRWALFSSSVITLLLESLSASFLLLLTSLARANQSSSYMSVASSFSPCLSKCSSSVYV